jgi:hypothetical protein
MNRKPEWALINLNYNKNKNYWHFGDGYFITCTNCNEEMRRVKECHDSKVCIHCGNYCKWCLYKYPYNHLWNQQMIKAETGELVQRDDLLHGRYIWFTLARQGDNSCPPCTNTIRTYLPNLLDIFIKDLHDIIIDYIDINEVSIIIDTERRLEQNCVCSKCDNIFEKNKYYYNFSISLCHACLHEIKNTLKRLFKT